MAARQTSTRKIATRKTSTRRRSTRPRHADYGFELYDLRVEVVAPPDAKIYCNSRAGDWFEVRGELLHFRPDMPFSMYSLAALLPLLPAKQRPTHERDWMTTDSEVACPDPNCPTRFKITRLGKRRFSHAETTAVPLRQHGTGKIHSAGRGGV